MTDWIENLERLKRLRDEGHLSDTEYESAKSLVLTDIQSQLRLTLPISAEADGSSSASPAVSDPDHAEGYATEHIASDSDGVQDHRGQKKLILGLPFIWLLLFLLAMSGFIFIILGTDRGIPTAMQNNCVGFGSLTNVNRPIDVSFGRYADYYKSADIKAIMGSSATQDVGWEKDGADQFVLVITSKDTLTKKTNVSRQSFLLTPGSGDLTSCGPNTLVYQRSVSDGIDDGERGLQAVLMILGMAKMTSPESAASTNMSQKRSKVNDKGNILGSSSENGTRLAQPLVGPASQPIQRSEQLSDQELRDVRGPVHLIRGSWVPEGEYCSGSAGLVFNDNVWRDEEEKGDWSFSGDELYIKWPGEQAQIGSTKWTGGDEFEVKWDHGGRARWRRCPGDGSKEPWFPNFRPG